MKRVISLFLVVLSFVITTPRQAAAQTATFADGNTIEDALKFIVKCGGPLEDVIFDKSADQLRRQKLVVSVTVTCGDMKDMIAAIDKVLPGAYTYHVDRGMMLHILAAGARDGDTTANSIPPAPAPTPSTPRPTTPAPTPSLPNVGTASDRLTMYDVPARYSPSRGISEAEWVLARNRMPLEPSVMAPPPVVTYGGGYPTAYPQVYAAAGVYGYGTYVLPWMKGCANGLPGYIKFKYSGKSKDRKFWNVYLNGEIVGSLDQGDSFFNRIDVCAGHNEVTVEKLGWDATHKARNTRPFSVRPGTLTEITVGDYLFEMDSHEELKIHILREK